MDVKEFKFDNKYWFRTFWGLFDLYNFKQTVYIYNSIWFVCVCQFALIQL